VAARRALGHVVAGVDLDRAPANEPGQEGEVMADLPHYAVHTVEPGPAQGALANLDSLQFEPPPCPLCESAYSHVMAHYGPSTAWLSCFLGHCVKVDEDGGEVTDKPRYTITMVLNWRVTGPHPRNLKEAR